MTDWSVLNEDLGFVNPPLRATASPISGAQVAAGQPQAEPAGPSKRRVGATGIPYHLLMDRDTVLLGTTSFTSGVFDSGSNEVGHVSLLCGPQVSACTNGSAEDKTSPR